jgi:hypothetical protein
MIPSGREVAVTTCSARSPRRGRVGLVEEIIVVDNGRVDGDFSDRSPKRACLEVDL